MARMEWAEQELKLAGYDINDPEDGPNRWLAEGTLELLKVFSEQGQWHHKHAHPNSFVSGVFYLNTNADDKIYFYRSGWKQIIFPPEEWNLYNSESWWFEAKVGRLILFPSSLEHNVPSVQGEETRISMSFNTFPVGIVGDEMELTGLKLEA